MRYRLKYIGNASLFRPPHHEPERLSLRLLTASLPLLQIQNAVNRASQREFLWMFCSAKRTICNPMPTCFAFVSQHIKNEFVRRKHHCNFTSFCQFLKHRATKRPVEPLREIIICVCRSIFRMLRFHLISHNEDLCCFLTCTE